MDKASEGQHELLAAFERMVALELEAIDAHERAALLHDEAAALLDEAASAQQNRDRRAELVGGRRASGGTRRPPAREG
jgi:hypothetical protein